MDNNVKLAATDLGTAGSRYAQPIVQNLPMANAAGGLLPAQVPLQTAPADVSAIGAVALMPAFSASQNLGNAITFTLDNSGGGAAVNYKMFDALGLLSAVGNITATGAVYESSGLTTAFNLQSLINPYTFSGFTIQSAVSAASLQQKLKFYELDSTGTMNLVPQNLGTASRNTAYNNQEQTFQIVGGYTATANRAVTFQVAAGETITITWFVAGQNGRLF